MVATNAHPIVLVPPIWWDRRALEKYSLQLPVLHFFDLPQFDVQTSNDDYVKQCAKKIATEFPIDSLTLVGYGESGPLAIEIAIQLGKTPEYEQRINLLLLIASSRTASGYGHRIRMFQRTGRLSKRLAFARYMRHAGRVAVNCSLPSSARKLIESMIRETNAAQWNRHLDWLTGLKRNRSDIDRLIPRIYQLHGRNDEAFEPPLPQDATLVGKADHLMWFTHEPTVANWIESVCTKLAKP